jgi:type II secretory pathway pseudopilin PulG
MSTLAIVLISVAAVVLLLVLAGVVATQRRERLLREERARRVAAADQALESARAVDKGWDRSLIEIAARQALASRRPDFSYEVLHLVLVDDRPGVTEDRAHFLAVGSGGEVRVVLTRRAAGWTADEVG